MSGPLEGILTEPLPEDYTPADIEMRVDALFDRYGIDRIPKYGPDTADEENAWNWEQLALHLASDFMACMWVSRPPGRPRKRDFTDDDAIIFYELAFASYERWLDKMDHGGRSSRPTMNTRARTVAKWLEKKTPVQIKNRFHTLRKLHRDVTNAMFARGEELARERKSYVPMMGFRNGRGDPE